MAVTMDLWTVCIFVLSFGVCAALVAAVSLFGAKEQTFEEALEEQKKKLAQEKNKHRAKKNADKAASKDAKVEKRKNARANKKDNKVGRRNESPLLFVPFSPTLLNIFSRQPSARSTRL